MVKKIIIGVFFALISFHATQCFEYVTPVLEGANSGMDYANKGWLQRLIFVGSGSLALATIVCAGLEWGKEDEEFTVTMKALRWGAYDLSCVLALHYVWHRWLPYKNWRGIGTIGVGLVLFTPFMPVTKDAVNAAAVVLATAVGATRLAKTIEEWNKPKKKKGA
jgi:hypothetical protein